MNQQPTETDSSRGLGPADGGGPAALGLGWATSLAFAQVNDRTRKFAEADRSRTQADDLLELVRAKHSDRLLGFILGSNMGFVDCVAAVRTLRPDDLLIAPNPAVLATICVPPQTVTGKGYGKHWVWCCLMSVLAAQNKLDDLSDEWLDEADQFAAKARALPVSELREFVTAAAQCAGEHLDASRAAARRAMESSSASPSTINSHLSQC